VKGEPVFALLVNYVIIMAFFMICRLFFFAVNHSYFEGLGVGHFLTLCLGGIQFDRTAVLYTNVLYIFLMVLPFRFRLKQGYQKTARWVFVVCNAIALLANCADVAFFPYTNRRTTSTIFTEFSNEDNMVGVIGNGIVEYWYVTLFAFALLYFLYKVYYFPRKSSDTAPAARQSAKIYYPVQLGLMCLCIYMMVVGMRGGFTRDTRPITLSNANQYVDKSTEAAIVLNTPFCMYRTINNKTYRNPHFFASDATMNQVFSPIYVPHPQGPFKRMNVVVLILESFGKEYSGYFNHGLEGGHYKGFTPFLDSLYQQGYTFRYSYATGRKSIDAMPSVLSSIPMFEEPFVLTSYSNNRINSIASELDGKGYYTAFFHGAPNGSMGFSSYAKLAGFKDYYGMTEYDKDPRFGGSKDFDGHWAIWDEEFLQFYAQKMNEFHQPFMTALFTASSHHPFRIPDRYVGKFPLGTNPIHKCIGYSDNALRQFFKTASRMPWYKNTLFVITADHTNQVTHDEYRTDEKLYSIPILFYQPGSNLKGVKDQIACQADIMPSVLGYLNYDKPYIAFGHDVLTNYQPDEYAVNYNNPLYQIMQGDYMLQFDGHRVVSMYNLRQDPMLRTNLVGKLPAMQNRMELIVKAQMQQYLTRMIDNRLTISTSNKAK
jgi:phosphoglycerol transferase MdoB-like AlkP superfamily enzyme